MKTVDILSKDSLYTEMLCLELRAAGYCANKGRSISPDLIIVDLDSMNAVQGFLSITFSSEKNADLCRPFDIEELLELIEEKTSKGTQEHSADGISSLQKNNTEDIYLSPYEKYALFRGEKIELSELEYRLLGYLFEKRGRAVSANEISAAVFKTESNHNLVRVYISYLREKIDKAYGVRMIVTVRNKGYMLKESSLK